MDFTRLDAFLDRITAWRIPGNDCIVYKDGKIVHRHFSGYAEIETGRKIDGSEVYNMWSCSKPITCAAALTLLERGDFLLTDPIETYLPEFADVKVKSVDENGNETLVKPEKKITVRDLFTMSSGYSYDLTRSTIGEIRRATGGRCPTRDVVRSFADIPLEKEPGYGYWVYGISHDILACLVEVIANERFADYVKRVIFDPLDMKDSTFGEPTEEMKKRMARQYSYDEKKNRVIPSNNSVSFKFGSEYDSGGAGLVSTAEDYLKFAAAMANGGVGMNGVRILAPETVSLMGSPALSTAGVEDIRLGNAHLAGYSYGLGVRVMIDPSQSSLGPVGEFGWAGAAGSYVLIDPKNNLAVFYAQHMLASQEPYITPRLRNIVYACLD